jgi:hypothetical protein
MRYSWTKFAIGVLAGIVGISVLFYDRSYVFLSVLLVLLSFAFSTQGLRSAVAEEPDGWTSDADEWRKMGRGFIEGLPRIAWTIAVATACGYAWDLAVGRWPVLPELSRTLVLIAFTALWLRQMVSTYRQARMKYHSARDVIYAQKSSPTK